jgi:hypothetical protein
MTFMRPMITKYLSVLICTSLFCSCGQNSTTSRVLVKDTSVYFAYAPDYTSGFHQGNPRDLKTVLDFWRAFEHGNLLDRRNDFCDSIMISLPGNTWKGNRDSVLNAFKAYRDQFTDLQWFVDSWFPAISNDHNEDWVFLWGHIDLSNTKGERFSAKLHQAWSFSKNGKIRSLEQYTIQ